MQAPVPSGPLSGPSPGFAEMLDSHFFSGGAISSLRPVSNEKSAHGRTWQPGSRNLTHAQTFNTLCSEPYKEPSQKMLIYDLAQASCCFKPQPFPASPHAPGQRSCLQPPPSCVRLSTYIMAGWNNRLSRALSGPRSSLPPPPLVFFFINMICLGLL